MSYDELLDITTEYLDGVDFDKYVESEGQIDMDEVKDRLLEDFNAGNLPELPSELEGDIFKAYDLWDLAVYLRERYNKDTRVETYYKYYLV